MIPLKTWRKRAQYFEAGGNRLAYWQSGAALDEVANKPLVLLIHGYPTSSWDWSAVWPALKKSYRLAAIDMLGFGLSDKPKSLRYRIADQADLQEAFMAHLGESNAHILAHDYGDTVAQELLARHNERALSFVVNSVFFLNGGLFPEQHRPRLIQKIGLSPVGALLGLVMSQERLRRAFDEIFGPRTKPSDEEIAGHWALIREQGGAKLLHKLLHYIPDRAAHRERWVGALREARAPITLLDGGADPVSGVHLYDYWREQIPGAEAVLLPEIGHYPQTEAPGEVVAAFEAFQQKLSAPLSSSTGAPPAQRRNHDE